MAEARAGPSGPPPKKAKKSTPLLKVTAEAQASQFAEDFYADGGILFFANFATTAWTILESTL